jgi:hypothetical protein
MLSRFFLDRPVFAWVIAIIIMAGGGLAIYNLLGQEVAKIVESRHLAGTYTITWDTGDFPSGVYLCRMEAGQFLQTRRLVLVK